MFSHHIGAHGHRAVVLSVSPFHIACISPRSDSFADVIGNLKVVKN